MKHRPLYASLIVFCTACSKGPAPPPPARVADGPNILLITIESLRTDHVGCYGGKLPTTPALDALARESIVFDNAWSVTSWTLSAHASLFTGLYPTATNVTLPRDRLDASYRTLAELLHDHGYDTAAIVSGPYLRKSHQLDQGFSHYDESAVSPAGQTSTDDITNPAMEARMAGYFDSRATQARPFFLFAYFWDPHYDYIPPPPYDTLFVPPDAKKIGLAKYDTGEGKVTRNASPAEMAYVLSQYDGEIRATDEVLGRLFDRLKKAGLWDKTVIVVTADHGEEFFDHGEKGHKNNLHVESVKVPLLIKPAGKVAPRRDARPASLVDVYPTLAAAAGWRGKLPPHHGRSLLQAGGEDAAVYGELTTSWYFTNKVTKQRWAENNFWLSLLEGPYRLIGMRNPEKKMEQWALYDVQNDPTETRPLGAEHATRLDDMKKRLLQWQEKMVQTGKLLGKRGEADLSPDEIERLKAIGYLN